MVYYLGSDILISRQLLVPDYMASVTFGLKKAEEDKIEKKLQVQGSWLSLCHLKKY